MNRSAIEIAAFVVDGFPSCKHGSQKPNCTPPKGEIWIAVGGSEFVPRNQRIPGTFDWDGGWPCSLGLAMGEQPELAFEANDQPLVAYAGEHSTGVHARTYVGGNWIELYNGYEALGVAFSSLAVHMDEIRVDPQGRPIVLWWEEDWQGLRLARFEQGAWNKFGLTATLGLGGAPGSVVADAAGTPMVFYVGGQGSQILATENIGTGWADLLPSGSPGGLSNTLVESYDPSAAISATGQIYVAWITSDPSTGSWGVSVRQLAGGAWNELAGSATGNGIATAGQFSYDAHIAYSSVGFPVVAWERSDVGTITTHIYLRRFDGVAWCELGGSASGLGVTGGPVCEFSIALDRNDNPVVAWRSGCASPLDADQGTNEVYLKQFNGTSWQGIDGSDSGGGISNSEIGGASPIVAVSNDLICVAWSEGDPYYAACDPTALDVPYSQCYPDGYGHERILMRCANY